MPILRSLPLFPLELVLYPGAELPLHIFEERYREMVQHCLEEEAPFGVVLTDEEALAEVGSTARIDRIVTRYEDGRLDIVAQGRKRFRIRRLHEERAYLTANVETLDESAEPAAPPERERAITQHMKLLELVGRPVRPNLYEESDHLAYILAQNAGLEVVQQQRVLEMASESERIDFLVRHFEALLPRIREQEDQRRRIQSNGHV